jgi:hypothetical protein
MIVFQIILVKLHVISNNFTCHPLDISTCKMVGWGGCGPMLPNDGDGHSWQVCIAYVSCHSNEGAMLMTIMDIIVH